MNALITAGKPATMSSREIAELTGKRHADVMRDIRIMMGALEQNAELRSVFISSTYVGENEQSYPQYELDKDTSLTLLLGYDPVARMKVVKRWQELESVQAPATTELSRMDILKLAMESEEARIKAEAERDEAIRTKSQISDKKTATAMATASAKSKEVNRLKHELGRNQLHATVKAVKKMTGTEYCWRKLKKHCSENNLEARNVADEQYGIVKAWPAMAWFDVHNVDLGEIFPTTE